MIALALGGFGVDNMFDGMRQHLRPSLSGAIVRDGGYHVTLFHDGVEFDSAGPFEEWEDAELAMERALRIGGAL